MEPKVLYKLGELQPQKSGAMAQTVSGHSPRYTGPITSQPMCDLWSTKGHWDRVFAQYLVFPVTTIPPMLHIHLHLHIALTWRAKRRSLSTLQRVRFFFFGNQGALETNEFFLALKDYSRRWNVAGSPQIVWCLLTHPPHMFERKHTFSKYGISIPTACWPRALFT